MSWYRAGTVAVTNGSTVVTGTETLFAANARVGDAIIFPGGQVYEVANVASDTVLSILPGYQGATVNAGAYALAPMQGYVKDSADALRALVNKFGSLAAAPSINALAALTGSVGMVPYYTAADTMGLVRLTASATDSTNGRLLRVGDFGLGGSLAPTPGTGSNLNNLGIIGTFRLDSSFTSGPYGAARQGDVVQIVAWNGGLVHQNYFTIEGQIFSRKIDVAGQTQLPWRRVYDSGNVVGTVAMNGSAVGGSIIERGINSNGHYVKFADGTLECALAVVIPSWPANGANGATWTFPAAFSEGSTIRLLTTLATSSPHVYNSSGIVTSVAQATIFAGGGVASSGTVYAFAMGKWN